MKSSMFNVPQASVRRNVRKYCGVVMEMIVTHERLLPYGRQVDTNVGRICVRLGWVPLEPLPEELQLHLLEL